MTGKPRKRNRDQKKGKKSLLSSPSTKSHALLNSSPNTLNNLPIPPTPTTVDTVLLVPALNSKGVNSTTPALNLARDILPAPSDIHTGSVLEQLRWRRPLVRLELPGLAGREDGDESVPVLRFEVGRAVDDDKLGWAGGFAGAGACARGVRSVAVETEWSL